MHCGIISNLSGLYLLETCSSITQSQEVKDVSKHGPMPPGWVWGWGQDCPDGKAPGARPQRRQVHMHSCTCVSMCTPSLLGTRHVKKDRWEKGPQTSLAWPLLFR